MICTNCGHVNNDHQNFCNACGTRLAPVAVSEYVPATAAPEPTRKSRAPKVLGLVTAAVFAILISAGVLQSSYVDDFYDNVAYAEEETAYYEDVDTFVIDPAFADGDADTTPAWDGDEYGYWHSQLSEVGKRLYEEMLEHLQAGETEFVATTYNDPNLEVDDIYGVRRALENDHPEIFWISCAGAVETEWVDSGLWLRMDVLYEPEERAELQAGLDAELDAFAATVTDDMTDWERALAAAEWLSRIADYDYDTFEVRDEEVARFERNAASALVNRLTVCAGYSAAFSMLCNRVGVPCVQVCGARLEDPSDTSTYYDNGHAWNLIYLCGEYGYCDPTRIDVASVDDWDYIDGLWPEEPPVQLGCDYTGFFMTDEQAQAEGYYLEPEDVLDGWEAQHLPSCDTQIGSVSPVSVRVG